MGKKNLPLRGKTSGLCPIGLMVFVCRYLPANEKNYISVFSISLWLAYILTNDINLDAAIPQFPNASVSLFRILCFGHLYLFRASDFGFRN